MDENFLSKHQSDQGSFSSDEVNKILRKGMETLSNYREIQGKEALAGRLASVVGALDYLFKGEATGKKIIDLGSGAGEIKKEDNSNLSFTPVLAQVLQKEGYDVLAVDKKIKQQDNYLFACQNLDLADFQPSEIKAEWQDSDAVISTSFLGEPSDSAGIDSTELIKKISEVAPLQIHYLVDGKQPFLENILDNEKLEQAGFEVLYNFTNHQDDDWVQPLLVIKKKQTVEE